MKQPSQNQRRIVFTTDAKLAIRRKPAAKLSADGVQEQASDDSIVTLEGYAMVWNSLSSDRGGFRVRLLPGSAKFTVQVHALFHHDFKAILGATSNGTLRITSDDVGVKVEIDVPDTTTGRDVATLVEGQYVQGMSFSMLFDPMPESTSKTEGGLDIEEISSFLCDEITITAIPSFTGTTIGLQEDDADDEAESPAEVLPFARIEQSIRLEQLRLGNMEI